jgi:hypothetical protein
MLSRGLVTCSNYSVLHAREENTSKTPRAIQDCGTRRAQKTSRIHKDPFRNVALQIGPMEF